MDDAESRSATVLMGTDDYWSASVPVRAEVQRVGIEHRAVLWDLLCPMRMLKRPEATFRNLSGMVRHVHDYDQRSAGISRAVALGTGRYDHEPPLRLLADPGFKVYASVEIIHRRGTEHDAEGVLRQYTGTRHKCLEPQLTGPAR